MAQDAAAQRVQHSTSSGWNHRSEPRSTRGIDLSRAAVAMLANPVFGRMDITVRKQ